ncbi:hypothetical protein LQL77_29665 [Rhodococcus cerastii]|nr:hypothetical protein [Rhodococcus cerastii]
MNLRHHVAILGIAAFVAATFFGTGIAHAEPTETNEIAAIAHSAPGDLPAPQHESRGIVPVRLSPTRSPHARDATTNLSFDCREVAPGHPYLVYDREGLFSPYTYQTEDGKPLGEYWWPDDIMPRAFHSTTASGSKVTRIDDGRAHHRHGYVTFYCASTPEEAHQSR